MLCSVYRQEAARVDLHYDLSAIYLGANVNHPAAMTLPERVRNAKDPTLEVGAAETPSLSGSCPYFDSDRSILRESNRQLGGLPSQYQRNEKLFLSAC